MVSVSQARSHGKAAREASLKVEALQELDLAMEKEIREKKVSLSGWPPMPPRLRHREHL